MLNSSSLKMLFVLSTMKNYKIITFDVKIAFLYGKINENIYTYSSEGYDYSNKICKLHNAIYGLKQTSPSWNKRFFDFTNHGFKQLKSEQCLFRKKQGNDFRNLC